MESRRRRSAISAQAVTCERLDGWTPPSYPKSDYEKEQLLRSIGKYSVLFGHLSNGDKTRVAEAMFKVHMSKGTEIIRQGDEGDNFYVIETGSVEFYVSRNDRPATKVGTASVGHSFGELALLYNSPRAATVLALEDTVLWALDRETFQMMLVTAENTKKRKYEEFLTGIKIFHGLTKLELVQLSDMLKPLTYRPGEQIIEQGENGSRFYIISEGKATCVVNDSRQEYVVCRYSPGGYFGELALLNDGIRKASVYAETNCTVLYIERSTFNRVLGSIRDTFTSRVNKYSEVLTSKRTEWSKKYSMVATSTAIIGVS